MLDGKRYYAVFPDEDPANRKPVPLHIIACRVRPNRVRDAQVGNVFGLVGGPVIPNRFRTL
jgi:hypothetical protein